MEREKRWTKIERKESKQVTYLRADVSYFLLFCLHAGKQVTSAT